MHSDADCRPFPQALPVSTGSTDGGECLRHLPALDGVRALAVLAVLVFHFWQRQPPMQLPHAVQSSLRLLSIGQKGVDLFFVLSGFLITRILIRSRNSPHYFKNFYIRRTLRIFPIYYLAVFLCLLAGWCWSLPQFSWAKMWWYLFYLQNIGSTFWPGQVSGPGHFWSLAVEEHFYLLWPLLVALVSPRRLQWLAATVIFLAFLCRILLLSLGYETFYFSLCRMDGLALGAVLAVWFGQPVVWERTLAWVRRLWWFAALAGVLSFFAFSGGGFAVAQAIKFFLFAVLCGCLLVLALDPAPGALFPRLCSHPSLRFIGRISYGMYVFHPFLFNWVNGIGSRRAWSPLVGHPAAGAMMDFPLCLGSTILIAWLSWKLFESPINALKERFQYGALPVRRAEGNRA